MRESLDERFSGEELDPDVWFPYYLPHWSSLAESAATYAVRDGELMLSIPPDQPEWCAGLHDEPLRVSCIQSGSLVGQQMFTPGLVVREEYPAFWGYTPHFGQLEITMRGTISPRSMFAFWLSGIEDRPEHSGEICVAEIFGDGLGDGTADVGMGVHGSATRRCARSSPPNGSRSTSPSCTRTPWTGGPGRWPSASTARRYVDWTRRRTTPCS